VEPEEPPPRNPESPSSPGPDTVAVERWPLPALLRAARAVFARAVREALDEAGLDDLPPNGPYVVAAVAGRPAALSSVIRQLGVSKQAAGQLVDTLVVRGYLHRETDPADRRRLVVGLTARGEAAALVVGGAVAAIETRLEARAGSRPVWQARQVLAALVRDSDGC
jgi:DNA-binding MarR family transcriptional regulator